MVIPHPRVGSHALLTRAPLSPGRNRDPVRLACIRPAASVRSEPGSNSQVDLSADWMPSASPRPARSGTPAPIPANRLKPTEPSCTSASRAFCPRPEGRNLDRAILRSRDALGSGSSSRPTPPPAHPFLISTMSNSASPDKAGPKPEAKDETPRRARDNTPARSRRGRRLYAWAPGLSNLFCADFRAFFASPPARCKPLSRGASLTPQRLDSARDPRLTGRIRAGILAAIRAGHAGNEPKA